MGLLCSMCDKESALIRGERSCRDNRFKMEYSCYSYVVLSGRYPRPTMTECSGPYRSADKTSRLKNGRRRRRFAAAIRPRRLDGLDFIFTHSEHVISIISYLNWGF